jgi:aminoglycoside 3-N-acetyltransferase
MEGAVKRKDFLDKILGGLKEVVTEKGTLAFATYSTQTARFGRPYIHETTKCINGMLSQYVLDLPESVRSVHPINSFAAVGKRKDEICLDVSSSNYGLDSPPDRILKMGGHIIFLGMDDYYSSVFTHYLEATGLVPYCYNKLLDIPVHVGGVELDTRFTANVRYLEYEIDHCFDAMKKALDRNGCVQTVEIGDGQIHRISAEDFCKVGLSLLRNDPFVFLESMPNFEKGKIPYDGVTADRDGVVAGGGSAYDMTES